jgi:MFS family permease
MMQSSWLKRSLPIAAIFAFRMLGLFMLIPIFSIYGQNLSGATPILIGIAIGAYGFSQGIMQMPFGIMSDYYGRKRLIVIGLLLFALGSILGAYTDSIYGMIFARIIQGMGAVGSVLIALIADNIEDTNRPKAMAIIGMSIGLSFALAMIISPVIAEHFGLRGIFGLTTILALCGLILLNFIPTLTQEKPSKFEVKMLKQAFLPKELQRCHLGIWGQHFILTSSFFAIPLILKSAQIQMSYFYLSLMLLSFVLMMPLIAYAERHQKREQLFKYCIYALFIAELLMLFIPHTIIALWPVLFIYFMGFNLLEALFPSMIAKAVNPKLKGTATGIYSSMQFLGIFCGGSSAGMMYHYCGISGIFGLNAILCLLYLLKFRSKF